MTHKMRANHTVSQSSTGLDAEMALICERKKFAIARHYGEPILPRCCRDDSVGWLTWWTAGQKARLHQNVRRQFANANERQCEKNFEPALWCILRPEFAFHCKKADFPSGDWRYEYRFVEVGRIVYRRHCGRLERRLFHNPHSGAGIEQNCQSLLAFAEQQPVELGEVQRFPALRIFRRRFITRRRDERERAFHRAEER